MFGEAGVYYVYFVYGMHNMLNVVVGPNDFPAAILIRGVGEIVGPARLTKKMNIDRSLNERTAIKNSGLWFEDRGLVFKKNLIKKIPRIGVDYAGKLWAGKQYRFMIDIE